MLTVPEWRILTRCRGGGRPTRALTTTRRAEPQISGVAALERPIDAHADHSQASQVLLPQATAPVTWARRTDQSDSTRPQQVASSARRARSSPLMRQRARGRCLRAEARRLPLALRRRSTRHRGRAVVMPCGRTRSQAGPGRGGICAARHSRRRVGPGQRPLTAMSETEASVRASPASRAAPSRSDSSARASPTVKQGNRLVTTAAIASIPACTAST